METCHRFCFYTREYPFKGQGFVGEGLNLQKGEEREVKKKKFILLINASSYIDNESLYILGLEQAELLGLATGHWYKPSSWKTYLCSSRYFVKFFGPLEP